MPDSTLSLNLQFPDVQTKEAFKTAFQGWLKNYQRQVESGGGAAGLAASPAHETIGGPGGAGGAAAPAGLAYIDFIPRW